MGYIKNSSEKEVQNNVNLPQETQKKSQIHNHFMPKKTRKRRKNWPTVSKKKDIIKFRVEINAKETKKMTGNETKSSFFEKINKIDNLLD